MCPPPAGRTCRRCPPPTARSSGRPARSQLRLPEGSRRRERALPLARRASLGATERWRQDGSLGSSDWLQAPLADGPTPPTAAMPLSFGASCLLRSPSRPHLRRTCYPAEARLRPPGAGSSRPARPGRARAQPLPNRESGPLDHLTPRRSTLPQFRGVLLGKVAKPWGSARVSDNDGYAIQTTRRGVATDKRLLHILFRDTRRPTKR